MQEPARTAQVDDLMTHLRYQLPRKTRRYEDLELRRIIRAEMARAFSYGITSGPDVTQYLYLSMVLGPGFDGEQKFASVMDILSEREVTPARRLERIFTLLFPDPQEESAWRI
jgi:hypothetical protein